jgi:YbbR domain-containing protein
LKKRDLPKNNEGLLLKLLSLVTAFFLWFYVVNSEPINVKKDYLVSAIGPVGLSVDKVSAKKITVTLKGARAFLKDYGDQAPTLNIDLSTSKYKGKTNITYTLSKSDFNLPFGVKVVDIKPQVLVFGLDKTIRKSVSVRANTVGKVSPQLNVMSLAVTPANVMIEGPRSVMRKTGLIKTKGIDISKLSGQGSTEAFLEDEPEFISYLETNDYKLNYDIRPKKANMTLKKIDIRFVSSNQKFKPSHRRVSLDVLIPDEKTLRKSDVKVYAEIPDGKSKRLVVPLRAVLPEGVHLLKIHPSEITIRR